MPLTEREQERKLQAILEELKKLRGIPSTLQQVLECCEANAAALAELLAGTNTSKVISSSTATFNIDTPLATPSVGLTIQSSLAALALKWPNIPEDIADAVATVPANASVTALDFAETTSAPGLGDFINIAEAAIALALAETTDQPETAATGPSSTTAVDAGSTTTAPVVGIVIPVNASVAALSAGDVTDTPATGASVPENASITAMSAAETTDAPTATAEIPENGSTTAFDLAETTDVPSVNASNGYYTPVTQSATPFDSTLTDFTTFMEFTVDSTHVGETDGSDIHFTTSDGLTDLKHELLDYNSSTGKVRAFVKCSPTSSGITVRCYHGEPNYSYSGTPDEAWDADFDRVYHCGLGDTSGGGSLLDSKQNSTSGSSLVGSGTTTSLGTTGVGQSSHNGSGGWNFTDLTGTDLESTDYTVEAYVTRDNNGRYDPIIGRTELVGQSFEYDWVMLIDNAGANANKLHMYTDDELYSHSAGKVTAGQTKWGLAIVRENQADDIDYYINGAASGSDINASAITVAAGRELYIGGDGGGSYYDGNIMEVRISGGTARSAAWLKASHLTVTDSTTYTSTGTEVAL